MRRVHREELRCESHLMLIGLRFDFIIEAPLSIPVERRATQLKTISSQLRIRVKGKNNMINPYPLIHKSIYSTNCKLHKVVIKGLSDYWQ